MYIHCCKHVLVYMYVYILYIVCSLLMGVVYVGVVGSLQISHLQIQILSPYGIPYHFPFLAHSQEFPWPSLYLEANVYNYYVRNCKSV